ncbi:hypothetical protein Daesc_008274 [Daldinia eschscholtzii]|uniref:F-box domain-containing protein n=1 Tax=Daldinia eschscholtzii TaxID=292717 RepID=A0AAX6MCN4_9PEZI
MVTPRNGLLSWPAEIIQKIGSNLSTPAKLFEYACVCKHVNSLLGPREFAKKDIQCLQAREVQDFDVNFTWVRRHRPKSLMAPDKLGDCSVFERPFSSMKPHGSHVPFINWAIEKGMDINCIKEIIDTYSKIWPSALNGRWWSGTGIDWITVILGRCFPSPMLVAIKSGRLDVIQVLIESGVKIRNSDEDEYIYHYQTFRGRYGERTSSQDATMEQNPFSLACQVDEKIALFMIHNGLDLRIRDLWWPCEFGRMQVLDTLLKHPLFKSEKGQQAIREVLHVIALCQEARPVKDVRVIDRLLDSLYGPVSDVPSPERKSWLEDETAEALKRVTNDYGDSLGMHLFDLLKKSGPDSIVSCKIAKQAARRDGLLEITRDILSQSDRTREGKPLPWIDEVLSEVSECICPRTAECLISYNYEFSPAHLKQVISATKSVPPDSDKTRDHLELMDIIISSGVSANSTTEKGNNMLEEALANSSMKITSDKREGLNCLEALRLLHHGADPKAVGQNRIKLFLQMVYRDRYLTDYCLHTIRHQSEPAEVSSEIFSEKIWSVKSPLYLDQVYAMAVLVAGKEFLEGYLTGIAEGKYGMGQRIPLSEAYRTNGFLGLPKRPSCYGWGSSSWGSYGWGSYGWGGGSFGRTDNTYWGRW